jgi:phosphoribosylamine---glycine ligase
MRADLAEVLMAAAAGELSGHGLEWSPEPSVCVVMASGGYPGKFDTGLAISGIAEAEGTGATVFQAGTALGPKGLETAGGRVLGVTASGEGLGSAIEGAYRAVARIHFERAHFRRDIGAKGLKRYNKNVGTGT